MSGAPSRRPPLSGKFLHTAHQQADASYRRRPIKEIGRCLHNNSIDNATAQNEGETEMNATNRSSPKSVKPTCPT
jgi:hypothetical protein